MRRRLSVGLLAAAVLGGLVIWPASPAAAQEVHSYQTNCFVGGVFETQLVFEISAVGPDEPVAAGEPFVLSDLTVTIRGANDFEWMEFDELVLLGGQVLDLGRFEQPTPAPPDESWVRPNWGPMDVELIAPDEGGVHGIGPESARITTQGMFVSGVVVCPNFGEVEPFAAVDVVAEPAPDPEPEPETPGDPGVDEGERVGSVDEDDAARVVRTEVRRVTPAVAQPAFTG